MTEEIKPHELHFDMHEKAGGFDIVYHMMESTLLHDRVYDHRHILVVKSAYDKAVEELAAAHKRIEKLLYDQFGFAGSVEMKNKDDEIKRLTELLSDLNYKYNYAIENIASMRKNNSNLISKIIEIENKIGGREMTKQIKKEWL